MFNRIKRQQIHYLSEDKVFLPSVDRFLKNTEEQILLYLANLH
jgi:hypothetical protein